MKTLTQNQIKVTEKALFDGYEFDTNCKFKYVGTDIYGNMVFESKKLGYTRFANAEKAEAFVKKAGRALHEEFLKAA